VNVDDCDLPEGWKLVTIGDVAKVVGGGTPKTTVPGNFTDEGGHPWITPADLTGYTEKYIARGNRNLTDQGLSTSSAKYMPAGTVLYSTRAPIGYTAIAANPVTTNQGFRSFVPSAEVDSEYLYYGLKLARPEAEQLASGTTFAELSGTNAKKLHLPLAPIGVQRQIVQLLSAAGASSASAGQHLKAACRAVERFRQSVLAAACSGRLTADWRVARGTVDDDLPAGWTGVKLGELTASIRGGSTAVPQHESTTFPILRSSSVRPFEIDYSDVRYLTAEQSTREANYLKNGDLLITRLSGSLEYVGNCAVVSLPRGHRIQYPDRLFCCRLIDPRAYAFVELVFAGPEIRSQIEAATRSAAGHQRISISDLKGFHFLLPPLDEQQEIVARVTQLLDFAGATQSRIDAASREIDRSLQAVLAKAFRGDLGIADGPAASADATFHDERGVVGLEELLPVSDS
jgi:type I restriction enzyme, S subunit